MAYLLVLSGLMLACGRLGDLTGFTRIFIAGFALFSLGSLLCGLAPTITLLVAARVVQGIGAAAITAIALAMIAVCLPADKRGWALGVLMTIVSVAIAAGPILGGFITEFLGWHWIFFVNVPVGIAAIILAIRYLPQDIVPAQSGRFDTAGAVLILAALATLLFPVSQGLYLGWTSPFVLFCLSASLLLLIILIIHERRSRSPLIELSLFTVPNFVTGNAGSMLIILAFAGSEFLLPFYFELVRGISTETVGLLLAVPAVFLMLAGPVAGKFSDRYGCRGLMIGSAALCAITMFLFSRFDSSTGFPVIVATLALEGIAIGLFVPPNMSLILGSARKEAGGVASGVMMTLRTSGAMLGIALLGTIAMSGFLRAASGSVIQAPVPDQLVPGFQVAYLVGAAVCIIVVVASLMVKETDRSLVGEIPPR
ncbi:MAG: MFS transporter, partial [Methanomicrobiales archaeon]|nr:MFS transporter [Methanomicrobiales archaeon]